MQAVKHRAVALQNLCMLASVNLASYILETGVPNWIFVTEMHAVALQNLCMLARWKPCIVYPGIRCIKLDVCQETLVRDACSCTSEPLHAVEDQETTCS